MKSLIHLSVLTTICSALLFFSSCSKEDTSSENGTQVQLKIEVAGCCNPWDGFQSDETELDQFVKEFLESEDINVLDIILEDNGGAVICTTCCGCPEGKTISIEVIGDDIQKAIDLGFTQ